MPDVPLLNVESHWECPLCERQHITRGPVRARPMHVCPRLGLGLAPFAPAGLKCTIVRNEREDYVGSEHVQTDMEGRPMFTVETIRDDGVDTTVFVPAAVGAVNDIR